MTHKQQKPKVFELSHSRKGQVQLTVNWIYIVIAGAVILLFFAGLVVKGKDAAEKNIAEDVVQVMGNVFTGAGVSEKTKNRIETSGLAEFTFQFTCMEGVSTFGIKDKTNSVQDTTQPTFSPEEIKTTRMLLWSLPYKLPYKIVDLLFVTSVNTKYFLIAFDDIDFVNEFDTATDDSDKTMKINWQSITTLEDVDPKGNFQIRIVDLDGIYVKENGDVPVKALKLADDKVTAVTFLSGNLVQYYQKQGTVWSKKGKPVEMVSLGGKRDAAKYAAIFANDGNQYTCNMLKAYKRLGLVNKVYQGKLQDLQSYYTKNSQLSLTKAGCYGLAGVEGFAFEQNLKNEMEAYQNKIETCIFESKEGLASTSCQDFVGLANAISNINQELQSECISLY